MKKDKKYGSCHYGLAAWAHKATVAHAEQLCRMMTHKLNKALYGEHTLVDKLKHGHKRELQHGHSRGGTGAATLLVGKLMGRMVGAYGEDASIG